MANLAVVQTQLSDLDSRIAWLRGASGSDQNLFAITNALVAIRTALAALADE